MLTPTYAKERKLLKNYQFIAGIDEVGRGPLAGPVVSAVVVLNPEVKRWPNIRDSKLLSDKQRRSLVDFIRENALDYGVGVASHFEIDELNIHHASLLSMRRAVESMKLVPEMILLDGKFKIPGLSISQEIIINGDATILSIAAASILAKVHRDDLMMDYANKFSVFGFEQHKGYDTSSHRSALIENGPCEIHRMSFGTVKEIMNKRFQKLMV